VKGIAEMKAITSQVSRKSATIFGNGTIPEPSESHIGKGVALVAQTAAFVYIYARIPQIAERTLSFHVTTGKEPARSQERKTRLSLCEYLVNAIIPPSSLFCYYRHRYSTNHFASSVFFT
jgi:hypothetical protein